MGIYLVEWTEKTTTSARVVADSEGDAIEKARRGKVIEGSQDSDPAFGRRTSYRVVMRLDATSGPESDQPGPIDRR